MVALEKGLSQDNLATRHKFMGGSDANILMNGSPTDVHGLYLLKRQEVEPEDWSWVLPVQIGVQTEPLNVKWFEHATGLKVDIEEYPRMDKHHSFRRATLDGWIDSEKAILECKHVNQFAKFSEKVEQYLPQLHHNMSVCGVEKAYLSVFMGTFNYEWCEVKLDLFYAATLLEREKEFWECVQTGKPPAGFEPVAPPVPQDEMRTVDMTSNNAWASWAGEYLENKKPAATFKKATEELKTLVEADVRLASGHGVQIKRAKGGSLRISEAKND